MDSRSWDPSYRPKWSGSLKKKIVMFMSTNSENDIHGRIWKSSLLAFNKKIHRHCQTIFANYDDRAIVSQVATLFNIPIIDYKLEQQNSVQSIAKSVNKCLVHNKISRFLQFDVLIILHLQWMTIQVDTITQKQNPYLKWNVGIKINIKKVRTHN